MKTIKSKITVNLMLMAVLMMAASACKKDEVAGPPTKEQLLATAKGWMLTTKTMLISGQTAETNVFLSMESDQEDNIFLFTGDGKISRDEGAAKSSNPNALQRFDGYGTWAFNTDKTKLTTTLAGLSISREYAIAGTTYTVLELTSTTLKISG
jgi:hypothetical protein